MDVEFVVHSVAQAQANVQTQVDGETMTAQVPCIEVELATVAERSGTLTLRLVGSGMAAAKDLFKPDAKITATFRDADAKYDSAPAEEAPASKKAKG